MVFCGGRDSCEGLVDRLRARSGTCGRECRFAIRLEFAGVLSRRRIVFVEL